MRIGGLRKVSLIDFPGRVCAVVFTRGCNFRCPYCHNPSLVVPARFGPMIDPAAVFRFLVRRQGSLEGVAISGGEPTLQGAVVDFACRIKEMGYLVKIDTNGSRPKVLADLFRRRLIDWVALDVKAPLSKYDRVTGVAGSGRGIAESIALIRDSGVPHEFRTTGLPTLSSEADYQEIGRLVGEGAPVVLQGYSPAGRLDPAYPPSGEPPLPLGQAAAVLRACGAQVRVR